MPIQSIKIIIDTNVPEQQPFDFTINSLHHPSITSTVGFEQYPYFTSDVDYGSGSEISKELNKKPYLEKVKFFFSKSTFERIINATLKGQSDTTPTKPETDEDTKASIQDITDGNILNMLTLLFPNSYLSVNNITSTYNKYVLNQSQRLITLKNMLPSSVKQFFPDTQEYYSYIKIGGKTYTTLKTIWLNDIFHHPVYKKFAIQYQDIIEWKNTEAKKIITRIAQMKSSFNSNFGEKGVKNLTNDIKETVVEREKLDAANKALNEKKKKLNQYDSTYNATIAKNEEMITFIDNFINDVKALESNIKESADYDAIIKLTDSISYNYEKIKGSIKISSKFANNISDLMDSANKIRKMDIIREKYINSDKHINTIHNEDKRIIEFMETYYKKYVDFIRSLNDIMPPKYESTNEKLQDLINSYEKGLNSDDFMILMNYSNLSDARNRELLNTGISKNNDNKLEIYVHLDLIGGELNDANKGMIDCEYKGDYLGAWMAELDTKYKKDWRTMDTTIFLDIDELTKKVSKMKDAKNAKKLNRGKTEKTVEPGFKKVGGRNRTRRMRTKYRG